MTDPIVQLVEEELAWFREVRRNHPELFPNQNNLYPIPFFGGIRRAEVLTLALNPSRTEFADDRHWPPHALEAAFVAPMLTSRLLHYFDMPVPAMHRWFRQFENALDDLHCSYHRNAAHIDVHPLPTKFNDELGEAGRGTLGAAIEQRGARHLVDILSLAPELKLILVIDLWFNLAEGQPVCTFDYLSQRVQPIVPLVVEEGARPPIFRGGSPAEFEARVAANRKPLREHRRHSRSLRFQG